MKSKQTDSTSSLKNGNLSLATFKRLRAQKFAKPKSRDPFSDITDTVAYLCLSKYVIGFCSVLENKCFAWIDAANVLFIITIYYCFVFQLIEGAVVPILKLNDRSERLEGDISVDIQNSIFNTYLQKCYGKMDPRVTPLVVIVKYWAKMSRITGAHDHKLSGQWHIAAAL